jgi:protein involved in polysaccharide export with SLBB domain
MRDVLFCGVKSAFWGRLAWLALWGPAVAMAQVGLSVDAPSGAMQAAPTAGAAVRAGEAGALPPGTGLPGGIGQLSRTLGSGSANGQVRVPGQLQGPQVGEGTQSPNMQADLGAAPALATTQFQRFVQEATGKLLPLYGYNLFDRGRFPSATDVPVPANYVLGPGDEVDLKIWGAVDVALRLPVDRDGRITVPKVGPLMVAGVRSSELDPHLKKQIGRIYTNFELSAGVGKLRSIQVFVVGQARNPGAYMVSSLSTLVGAVFESGGPSASGSMRRVDLMRAGNRVASIDLYKFIQAGHVAADARLLPGDVIVFPPAGPRVGLTGALDNPFIFELAGKEESIAQVLSYSASPTTLATPHKVLVERVDNRQTQGPREVQERALDEQGLKTSLRDGDLVTLFQISPQFANAVTLRGNVASPLRYAFKPGMKVSDLIPEPAALIMGDYYRRKNILVQYERGVGVSAERSLSETKRDLAEINWAYASVERADRQAISTRLITFNLGKAIKDKDPAHDLALQPGDVVTVFGVDDLPVPKASRSQYVKVTGEVRAPGVYELKPGETLPQLIERAAGGFTREAYVYGTSFLRESARIQQQNNLDAAVRRLENQLISQSNTAMQNQSDARAGQALQAQLAAQRQVVERLRGLKATGRVALDLLPQERRLPALMLEDGDAISVPSRSDFVAVFGAVLSENNFLYKPNLTLGDYLERSGPSREADLDSVFLIRADGSVLANPARNSTFGWGQRSFLKLPLNPGDSVFVPELADRRSAYTQFVDGAKDWTQLLFQLGLGAAAVKTLRN